MVIIESIRPLLLNRILLSAVAMSCMAAVTSADDCDGNGLEDCAEIAAGAADIDGDGVLDGCETARGDLNLDGTVDAADVGLLIANWGPQTTDPCAVTVPEWATLLEVEPDSVLVSDEALRTAIMSTGLPWRVRDTATGIEFVLIPPGVFQMGCSSGVAAECAADETPVHEVTISQPYYLSRTEITQEVWLRETGTNTAYHQYADDSPTRPVERVRWQDAVDFLSARGMRLPTEAEWEYAYRAGTTTAYHGTPTAPDGSNITSGLAAIGWTTVDAGGETHPSAAKAPNGFGVFDMSGNVWEWCSDWYDPAAYDRGDVTDPTGPRTGTNRVARGGSWANGSGRSSDRQALGPGVFRVDLGVRAVRNP